MGPSVSKSYFRGQKYIYDIVALYKRRPDLKAFLELFLSLITIGIFAFLAIRPTALTISNLLKEKAEKQDTIKQMDTKIQNLQIAQGVLSSQSAKISLLTDAVPPNPNLGSYVRQIEGIAKKDNASLQNLGSDEVTLIGTPAQTAAVAADQDKKTLPPNAASVGVLVSVSGDYNSIASFLADMELLRRPLLFDNITFSATQIDNVKSIFLTVNGRAPYEAEVTQK